MMNYKVHFIISFLACCALIGWIFLSGGKKVIIERVDVSKYERRVDSLEMVIKLSTQRDKEIIDSLLSLPPKDSIRYVYVPIRNSIDSANYNELDSILSRLYKVH